MAIVEEFRPRKVIAVQGQSQHNATKNIIFSLNLVNSYFLLVSADPKQPNGRSLTNSGPGVWTIAGYLRERVENLATKNRRLK